MSTGIPQSIHVTEGGRKALELFHQELATYCRELPRLLSEGEEGRYAVLQGEQILGTWDTYRDASQYTHFCPADQHFMIHRVDSRDLGRLEQLLKQEGYSQISESNS